MTKNLLCPPHSQAARVILDPFFLIVTLNIEHVKGRLNPLISLINRIIGKLFCKYHDSLNKIEKLR